MSSRSRKARILIVLAIAAAIGASAWWLLRPAKDDSGHLTLYGNVELRDAQLAFNEQEHIAEVLVDEGDQVKKGQLLARLVQDRLQAQLREAEAQHEAQAQELRQLVDGPRPQELVQGEAQLAAAQARLADAERQFDRLSYTSRQGASTKQELDDARAKRDVAQAERNVEKEALDLLRQGTREETIARGRALLEASAAKVTLLKARLEDTLLRSPSDGVIQSRVLEPGEMALPSRPVFVLAPIEPKWVRAYLPEPALGLVKGGMPARILSDADPEQPIRGHVGFVSPTAEFTPKSVQTAELRTKLVYETRIWVDEGAEALRLGQPVTVEIDLGSDPGQAPSTEAGTTPTQ